MGKFLKRNKLPKLSQEPTDQLNSPVSSLEILFYIYPFHEESLKPTQISKRPHAKGRKLTIPHNAWKTEEVIFSNLFYDGCIIQRQKPDKDIVRKVKKNQKNKKHNYTLISLMNIDVKILNKSPGYWERRSDCILKWPPKSAWHGVCSKMFLNLPFCFSFPTIFVGIIGGLESPFFLTFLW